MDLGMGMELPSHPVRFGLGDAWASFGDLVEEAAASPSVNGARDAVTGWLERHLGTSAAFVARLAQGAGESYLRHVDARVRDRLFADIELYAPSIARFTELSLAERGALVRPLDAVEPLGAPLVRDVLVAAGPPVGVFGVVTLGTLPVLHVYLGHERTLEDERSLIRAAFRVLGMAELAHAPLAPAPAPADEASQVDVATSLTPREREVLEYLALGYTNGEIATACGNAANTVKRQLASVFRKLGVSTRAEAVRIAMLEGYVVPRIPHRTFG